jgi:hypothetical protein
MHKRLILLIFPFMLFGVVENASARAWKNCAEAKRSLYYIKKQGLPGWDPSQATQFVAEMEQDVRNTCSLGPAKAYQIEQEQAASQRQNAQVGSALLSFGLGFLGGYLEGGGNNRQSAPAQAGRTTRGTTRTVTKGQRTFTSARTTTVNTAPSVRSTTVAPVVRTTGSNTVVNSGAANVQLNGNKSGVIGTVTQPGGAKDPIYSTPCKPQQTGTTSFDCGR